MLQLSITELAAITGGKGKSAGGGLFEATHLQPASYAPPPENHGPNLAAELGLGASSGGKHAK